ncbi:MAG: hypothetical protein IKR73_06210 [Oscillospiraceae bacterium]|nr:hypothetical protein [Oscillospiraceae bacterium]
MFSKKEWALIAVVTVMSLITGYSQLTSTLGMRRSVPGLKEPVQTEAKGHDSQYVNGYNVNITYKYAYDIEGLVVHTMNYSGLDLGSKLAPRDIAIAWGQVAARNGTIDFHWSQQGRWYYWRLDNEEDIFRMGGMEMIGYQSSNNHLIPMDGIAKRDIMKIKTGDHIRIKGYLVDVYGSKPDGSYFTWNSSVSREDTGNGACEVIYVTDVYFLD